MKLKIVLLHTSVQFEEIYVDKDQKAAEEMVSHSGQMGVPFTVITKDDGMIINIVGFNKEELDTALGL